MNPRFPDASDVTAIPPTRRRTSNFYSGVLACGWSADRQLRRPEEHPSTTATSRGGTIMTFFAWPGARRPSRATAGDRHRVRRAHGALTWLARLEKSRSADAPAERLGRTVRALHGSGRDGALSNDAAEAARRRRSPPSVIGGFTATIPEEDEHRTRTARMMGFAGARQRGRCYRAGAGDGSASNVDLPVCPTPAMVSCGIVHQSRSAPDTRSRRLAQQIVRVV